MNFLYNKNIIDSASFAANLNRLRKEAEAQQSEGYVKPIYKKGGKTNTSRKYSKKDDLVEGYPASAEAAFGDSSTGGAMAQDGAKTGPEEESFLHKIFGKKNPEMKSRENIQPMQQAASKEDESKRGISNQPLLMGGDASWAAVRNKMPEFTYDPNDPNRDQKWAEWEPTTVPAAEMKKTIDEMISKRKLGRSGENLEEYYKDNPEWQRLKSEHSNLERLLAEGKAAPSKTTSNEAYAKEADKRMSDTSKVTPGIGYGSSTVQPVDQKSSQEAQMRRLSSIASDSKRYKNPMDNISKLFKSGYINKQEYDALAKHMESENKPNAPVFDEEAFNTAYERALKKVDEEGGGLPWGSIIGSAAALPVSPLTSLILGYKAAKDINKPKEKKFSIGGAIEGYKKGGTVMKAQKGSYTTLPPIVVNKDDYAINPELDKHTLGDFGNSLYTQFGQEGQNDITPPVIDNTPINAGSSNINLFNPKQVSRFDPEGKTKLFNESIVNRGPASYVGLRDDSGTSNTPDIPVKPTIDTQAKPEDKSGVPWQYALEAALKGGSSLATFIGSLKNKTHELNKKTDPQYVKTLREAYARREQGMTPEEKAKMTNDIQRQVNAAKTTAQNQKQFGTQGNAELMAGANEAELQKGLANQQVLAQNRQQGLAAGEALNAADTEMLQNKWMNLQNKLQQNQASAQMRGHSMDVLASIAPGLYKVKQAIEDRKQYQKGMQALATEHKYYSENDPHLVKEVNPTTGKTVYKTKGFDQQEFVTDNPDAYIQFRKQDLAKQVNKNLYSNP